MLFQAFPYFPDNQPEMYSMPRLARYDISGEALASYVLPSATIVNAVLCKLVGTVKVEAQSASCTGWLGQ